MDSKNDLFDFNNLDNPEIKSKINPMIENHLEEEFRKIYENSSSINNSQYLELINLLEFQQGSPNSIFPQPTDHYIINKNDHEFLTPINKVNQMRESDNSISPFFNKNLNLNNTIGYRPNVELNNLFKVKDLNDFNKLSYLKSITSSTEKLNNMFSELNKGNQKLSSTLLTNLNSAIFQINKLNIQINDNMGNSIDKSKKQILSIIQYTNYQKTLINNISKQLEIIIIEQINSWNQQISLNNNFNNDMFGNHNASYNTLNSLNDISNLFKNIFEFNLMNKK